MKEDQESVRQKREEVDNDGNGEGEWKKERLQEELLIIIKDAQNLKEFKIFFAIRTNAVRIMELVREYASRLVEKTKSTNSTEHIYIRLIEEAVASEQNNPELAGHLDWNHKLLISEYWANELESICQILWLAFLLIDSVKENK